MSENVYSLRGRVAESRSGAGLAGVRVVATDRPGADAALLIDATTDSDGRFVLVFATDNVLALLASSRGTAASWESPVVLHLSAYDGDRRLGSWTRTTSIRTLLAGGELGSLEVAGTAPATDATLIVRAQTAAGEPVSGIEVRLERIGLTVRSPAGRGVTGQDGAAVLAYTRGSQGTRADTAERLQVTMAADGRELGRSAVLFGLADGREVVLVVDDDARVASELDRLRAAISPIADDAALLRLDAEQFELAAADANVYPPHLATWIAALRVCAGTRVDPVQAYALARIGVPLDPASLFVHSPPTYAEALRRAVQRRVIAPPGSGLDAAAAALTAAMHETASRRIGGAEPQRVPPSWSALRASGLAADRLQAFARRWLAIEGDAAARWAAVRADRELSRDADLLEFTAGVSAIVGHHLPAVEALVAERSAGRARALRSFAGWNVARWTTFLRGRGLPSALSDLPAEEGLRRYAETAARVVEAQFPTAVLVERLDDEELGDAAAIRELVRSQPDFDFDRTIIVRFLAEHPDALPAAERERVVANLSRLQRVHGLARGLQRSDVTRALLRRGIGSAAEVVRFGRSPFVRTFAADLDGVDATRSGAAVAGDVFARARQRHGVALAWTSTFTRAFQATPMTVLANYELVGDDPAAARLRDLFGSLDYCACEHCRSMFGPAAYLVDLLSFLQVRPAVDAANALEVLRSRRADLTGIELSCANTTTEMPYIDLVLELLEQLAIDVDAPLEPRQTGLAAAELRVQPEHRLDEAYQRTSAAVFPWSLPFDRPLLLVRAAMAQLGVPRAEAMTQLARPAPLVAPVAMDVVAEALGISPPLLQIISGTTAYPAQEFAATPADAAWGMQGVAGWEATLAGDVGQLIRRANVPLLDLRGLLALEFVGDDGEVEIVFDTPSCDLADARVQNLDVGVLDRLHRFLRLCRAVPLSSAELDRAIAQLGGGTLDATFAQELVDHLAVTARLRRPSDLVLALWHPLDTRRRADAPSPYEQLFRNRVSTPELDPAFELLGSDLAPVPLAEPHFATISAALGLNDAGLRLLTATALPANAMLSIATLSQLHRHALLAKAAGRPLADLLRLLRIVPEDPFERAASTLAFLDALDRLKPAKLSLAELDYVLRHQRDELEPVEWDDATVDEALAAIATLVSEGDVAIESVQGELPDVVAGHLDAILPGPIEVSAWMSILAMAPDAIGAEELAVLVAGLADVVADPDAAAQQIAGASGEARLELVRDLLVDFRRARVRDAALTTVLAERLQLEAEAVRTLLFEIVHEGGVACSDLLLPDGGTLASQRRGVRRMHKAALVVRATEIATTELRWFFGANQAVRGMDLDALPLDPIEDGSAHLAALQRVLLGKSLRQSLADPAAIEEASAAPDLDTAISTLAAASGWDAADIAFVLGPEMLAVAPADLEDPEVLATVRTAIDLVRRSGVAASRLAHFSRERPTPEIATDVVAALRSRYDDAAWAAVYTPIADRLRTAQRDALVDLLLGRGDFADPIALYDRLLVDPLMQSCMVTSRIRLAMSAAQLFIQRALMNLEDDVELTPADAEQYGSWMKNYRVWEANRKVFFYPENWVEPELRDDKSPFFLELERHLSQAELSDDYVEAGYKDYLRKLHEVSHLEVPALVREAFGANDQAVVHVLGRTRGMPMNWFHRSRVADAYWTPWTKVPVDIPTDQVTLATHNRRLFALWVESQEEAAPGSGGGAGLQDDGEGGLVLKSDDASAAPAAPPKVLRMRIGWAEHRDGAWTPKKITPLSEARSAPEDHFTAPNLCAIAYERGTTVPMLFVDVLARKGRTVKALATFRYDDCRDLLEERTVTTIAYEARDLGMGDGTVADRQRDRTLTETSLADEGLDLPRWQTDDYTSPLFLTHLPHDYWVTPARQSRLYAGLTPVVFDDEERAFYIVPQLLDQGNPVGILPGNDPWESYALLPRSAPEPSVTSQARAARRAEAKGPAPWNGVVPGLVDAGRGLARNADTQADVVFAWAEAHAVLPALSSRPELTVAPAPVEASYFHWGYRIDRFHHPYTCDMLATLNRYGIEGVLAPASAPLRRQLADVPVVIPGDESDDTSRPYQPEPWMVRPPFPRDDFDFETQGAYSIYNWELFFHAPLLIAERLRREQKFEQAQRWYHFVFNPLAGIDLDNPDDPDGISRFWNVKPLHREAVGGPIDVIRSVFLDDGLLADPELVGNFFTSIGQWLANPFSPHAIARVRAGTYQKVVVRKYLDNLLAWGDSLFRQDTMESINEATQIYLLAAGILGPRPQQLPALDVPVRTYDQLVGPILFGGLTELENFVPDAVLDEAAFPADDDTPPPGPIWWAFCLPPNEQLLAYWDVVADRLFKIRNCQNIDGMKRSLALFEPPIDPALLVRARAMGLDLGAVVAGLNAPLPFQRFRALHGRALELCADVRGLGSALLAALEKRDSEQMALLRSAHEIALLEAVREVRAFQLTEAERQLEATNGQRAAIEARHEFYRSREKISGQEAEALALAASAFGVQLGAQSLRALAGLFHLIPDADVGAVAILPVAKLKFGGTHVAPSLSAAADVISMVASGLEFGAQRTSNLAGYQRRKDDWTFQAEQANAELDQLARQVVAAEIRVDVARNELRNHELQIEQARAVDEVMRSKYTGEALYEWMVGQIAAVHFQSYQLALDMARKAERALQYELGREDIFAIEGGYWDSLKKGLLAGERLLLDLRRLDAAYVEQNRREYELVKHISLRQLDPLALLALKATGVCEVTLPEWLFDLDCPGHYMRRIRTVGFSVPCVVGPYASVNCTASLHGSTVRYSAGVAGGYERDGADSLRFVDRFGAVQSVVTSRAANDSGLFESGGGDDRLLPFEGCGALSEWRLELPAALRHFDYETISDVVIHMSYTARDGGEQLRAAAAESVRTILAAAADSPLVLLVSLRSDYAGEWHRYVAGEALAFAFGRDRFPYIASGRSIEVQSIRLLLATDDPPVSTNLSPQQVGLDALPSFSASEQQTLQFDFVEDEGVLPRSDAANPFLLMSYSIE
jgi:hypothetical protein